MKILSLLSAILLFACTSDSYRENLSSSIQGKWYLTSSQYQGINDSLNDCDLQTYKELNNSGTGVLYLYYTDWPENPEIEPCGLDDTLNVTFDNTSTNTYSMAVDWGDGEVSSGTATTGNNLLTFSGLTSEGESFEEIYTKE